MKHSFKDSILKIFIPVSIIFIYLNLLNYRNESSSSVSDSLFAIISISIIGGSLIYILGWLIYFKTKLNQKLEIHNLEIIRNNFEGKIIGKNIIKFQFSKLECFCKGKSTKYPKNKTYSFHIPRKYILKKDRKFINFTKPSLVDKVECFQIHSFSKVSNQNLIETEKKLLIVEDGYTSKIK